MCISQACSVTSTLQPGPVQETRAPFSKMRSSTLLALLVCVVFVSSGFRTAFGQDESQEEEEKPVETKSDDVSGEAHSGSQERSGNQAASGEQEVPGKPEAASGEQEVLGKLQADPDGPSRTELLGSAEVGEVDADERNSDVETLPEIPETEQLPDAPRSGNLDTSFGK